MPVLQQYLNFSSHTMKYLFSLIILCFGTVNAQTNCETYRKNHVPKDLDDAITYLTCIWSEKDKDSFKVQPEREAVTRFHFGTGLGIRNGWGLWKGKNSLVRYFKKLGIFHPDDMSSIILTSFHRQLNHKQINLDAQVQYYIAYWDSVKAKQVEHNKLYKGLRIGDTVNIAFSKSVSGGKASLALLYYDASTNDTANCFVKGVIVDKQKRRTSRIVTISIIGATNCENSILGNTAISVGEKFGYNMTYFNLSKN